MRSPLIFLIFSCLCAGCSRSYIELKYNEGNTTVAPVEIEETDVPGMRQSFASPPPEWLKKTSELIDG